MNFEEWYQKHYQYEPTRENLIIQGKNDYDFTIGEVEEAYDAGKNNEKMETDKLASVLEQLIKEAGTYCADCDVIIYDIGNHKADHSLSSTGTVAKAKEALSNYKKGITHG